MSFSDLSPLLASLDLQERRVRNPPQMANLQEALANLQQQMANLVAINATLTTKLTQLEENQTALQQQNAVTITEYEDVNPIYVHGDSIQLDAFKVIPEFNGDRKIYRSWRSQVMKMMKQIANFKTHPKYAAALSIIRAKITKNASDILINNNTAHNIDAIIDRLDFSYSDQRPLYVIEAEMTMIRQNGKTLQEYYDEINQALNMVLTKITMTYKQPAEQKSLIAETQSKAIRTFITGLNSSMIRTTLYGSMPKTLSEAFAVAQTIQYDNQHLQLEFKKPIQPQIAVKKHNDNRPISNPNFRYQPQPPNQMLKQNITTEPQQKQTPMDVDTSKQYLPRTQFQPNNWQGEKRPREQSFQYNKPQQSFQHVNKQQRINNVDEAVDIQSVYDESFDSLENNHDTEAGDSQTNMTEQESIFLEE